MVPTLDSVSREALVLPPDQRMTLACRLLESVEQAPDEGAAEAWDQEIEERIARFDRGETTSIPAVEVFKRLRDVAPGI
jgi:putative addiction module component (TIGR02574 family)